MLIGLVGQEPEVREVNGGKVVTFSVATTERYRDRNGETNEQTEWHRVVAWRHTAEYAERAVRKGSQIYVEGKLKTRKWNDQQGNERTITEVQAESLQVLGRKQDGNNRNTDTNDSF